MSTPQDGLANVIADVSFTTAGAAITSTPNRFQVGPAAAPPAVAGVNGVGIVRTGTGVFDVAIDAGKGCGPVTVASSLQAEFSVAFDGTSADGTVPMLWTVIESPTSTSTIRVYTFQFYNVTAANPSVVTKADPVQATITIRRKKSVLPQ